MDIDFKEKVEKATDLILSKTSTDNQIEQGQHLIVDILELNPPEQVRFLSMVIIKDKVKKGIYDSVRAIEHTNFLMHRESHVRTGLSFMPLSESKALRVTETIRSIPSTNIKFRVTENIDPVMHQMVHSKETMDKLPRFIDLLNKVTKPSLQKICQDLRNGVKIQAKKKQALCFFEKLSGVYHYLELKSLNSMFFSLKEEISKRIREENRENEKISNISRFYCALASKLAFNKFFALEKIKKKTQDSNIKKISAISRIFCTISPKIIGRKCGVFYNLKNLVEPEFTNTIQEKIFEQIKTKSSPTTATPLKSELITRETKETEEISERRLEKTSFIDAENKEKFRNVLRKIQTKCENIERLGERTFFDWKVLSLEQSNKAMIFAYFLRDFFYRAKKHGFQKIKNAYYPENTTQKLLKIFEISKIFTQRDSGLKFAALQKMKTSKISPFDIIKKLQILQNIFSKIKQKNCFFALNSLKNLLSTQQIKKAEILKRLATICGNFQRNIMRSSLWALKGEVEEKKLKKIDLNERMKAKILMSCYKQCPVLSLRTAFFRFKVRSDKHLVKKAIDRFALTSRITSVIAYWRLRFILDSKKRNEKKTKNLLSSEEKKLVLKQMQDLLKKTKYGNLILSFMKWKELRQNRIKTACNSLEKKITQRIQHSFNAGFKKLEYEKLMGNNTKLKSASVIYMKLMGVLRQYFEKWYSRNTWFKSIQTYEKINKINTIVNAAIKNNLQSVFLVNTSEILLKNKIFEKIKENLHDKIKNAFDNWVNMVKMKKFQDKLKDFQTEKIVSVINRYLMKLEQQGIKRKFNIWKEKTLEKLLKRKFLSIISRSSVGKVNEIFIRWRDAPEKKEKKSEKGIFNLLKVISPKIRKSFDIFKNHNHIAENIMVVAINNIAKTMLQKDEASFNRWYNLTKTAKIMEIAVKTEGFLDRLNKITITNFAPLYSDDNLAIKRENALKIVLKNTKNQTLEVYKRWKNLVYIKRITNLMDNEKRKYMVEKFEKFSENNSKAQLRNALHKFRDNWFAKQSILKLYNKFLSSSNGSIYNTFLRWKLLPTREKDDKSLQAVNDLERKLNNLAKNSLKNTFDPLIDQYYHGENIKKRAIKDLVHVTMNKQKKMLLHWENHNLNCKNIEKVKYIWSILENLRRVSSDNISTIFQSDKNEAAKAKAIKKLINSMENRTVDIYNKWKNLLLIKRIQNSMNEKIKQNLIHNLENYLNNNENQQLRDILHRFKENYKGKMLMNKLCDKLLGNSTGKILQMFNKWKNLPNRKEMIVPLKEKGITELERKLNRFTSTSLKSTFDSLKEQNYLAENTKKRCVKDLILQTMDKQKKMFLQWVSFASKEKRISFVKYHLKTFEALNQIIFNNWNPIMESPNLLMRRENALKLILSKAKSPDNKAIFYEKWKNYVLIKKIINSMRNDLKKVLVTKFEQFSENNLNAQLRMILKKFHENLFLNKFKINLHKKLLTTGNGKIMNAFLRWKLLPEPHKNKEIAPISDLEKKLQKIAKNAIKTTFDPLQEYYYTGENNKKRYIKDLIYVTMNKEKKCFLKWHMFNTSCNNIEKAKNILNIFENLNTIVTNANFSLFESDKNNNLRAIIVKKLVANIGNKSLEAYKKWKNYIQIAKIESLLDKNIKEKILTKMNDFVENNNENLKRKILRKFYENSMNFKIISSLKGKLLNTSIGKIFDSFNKWKNLPEKKQEDLQNSKFSNRLEQILYKFSIKKLKNTFDQLKDDSYRGENTKKRAIKDLIQKTMNNQKRYFIHWANFTHNEKKVIIIKKIIENFITLNDIIVPNVNLIFDSRETDKRMICIRKLVSNNHVKLFEAFKKWANYNKIASLQEQMNDNLKRQILSKIDVFSQNNEKEKLRKILKAFEENTKKKRVMRTLFNKLNESQVGNVLQFFEKWKNLPLRSESIVPLNKKGINDLEKNLSIFAIYYLKNIFDIFKENYIEGNNTKKRTLKEMIVRTMESQKRNWLHWSNYSHNAANVEKIKYIMKNFQTLNDVISNSNSSLLSKDNSQEKQDKYLRLLVKNTQNRTLDAYIKWKNYKEIKKITNSINNEKKRYLVERFEKYSENNSKAQLRNALHKFRDNWLAKQSILKLYNKFLSSANGSIYNTFLRWKSLPIKEKKDKSLQAVNDLERKLNNLAKNSLKNSFDPLIDQYYCGENIKKRAIKDLVHVTMNKQKKLFLHWENSNLNCKNIEKVKCIWTILENLSRVSSDNISTIFQSDKNEVVKAKAIKKLINSIENRTVDIYNKWKNLLLIKRIQNSMNEKIKQNLIHYLENYLNNNENQQLRDILHRFKENYKGKMLMNKLCDKLLGNSTGKILQMFNKWKNLPNRKEMIVPLKEKGITELERKLNRFTSTSLKSTFDSLKEQNYLAENTKKRCVKDLIMATMSSEKLMFLRWATLNQKLKTIYLSKITITNFQNVNHLISTNISSLFKDDEKMKQAITLLIKNTSSKEAEMYEKWKNYVIIKKISEKMTNQLKAFILQKIEIFERLNENSLLRQTLAKFRENANLKKFIMKLHNKMLATHNGKIIQSFLRWKALPLSEKQQKPSLINDLERNISELVKRNLKNSFDPLKEKLYDAENIEKRAVKTLIYVTTSKEKHCFNHWKSFIEINKFLSRFKAISTIFANLNVTLANNTDILYEKEENVKEKLILNRLISCTTKKEEEIYYKWKNYIQILKIQRQISCTFQKKIIKDITNFLEKSEGFMKRLILTKFRENANNSHAISKIKDLILSSQNMKIFDSFNKWKNLPERKTSPKIKSECVTDLERKLNKFSLNDLKSAFDPLKSLFYDGENKKKRIIKELIIKTMDNQKRYFLHWANILINHKKISSIKKIITLFDSLNNIVSDSNSLVLSNDDTREKKIKYLSLLVNNSKIQLKSAFDAWIREILSKKAQITNNKSRKKHHDRVLRHANHQVASKESAKVKKILNVLHSFAIQQSNITPKFQVLNKIFSGLINKRKKLGFMALSAKTSQESSILALTCQNIYLNKLHLAFFQIKLEASNDLVKAYCNTLWKWKMANVRASYDSIERKLKRVCEKYRMTKIEALKAVLSEKLAQRFFEFKKNSGNIFWKENFYYLQLAQKILGLKQKNIQRVAFLKIFNSQQEKNTRTRAVNLNILVNSLINKRKLWSFCLLSKKTARDSSLKKDKKLYSNLSYLSKGLLKKTFDRMKTTAKMNKKLKIFHGILNLMRFSNSFFQSNLKFSWLNLKNYYPEFPKARYKKAVNVLAKHATLNRQIALWRLKDNIMIPGAHLSAAKILKCKKLFNNIRILYERSLTKAFFTIEGLTTAESRINESRLNDSRLNDSRWSASRINESRLNESQQLLEKDSNLNAKSKFSKESKIDYQEKAKKMALRKMANKSLSSIRGAFDRWAIRSSIVDKHASEKLKKNLTKEELDYVTKIGACMVMAVTIITFFEKKKKTYNHIFFAKILRLSKIEKGVDLYNQILNSDKTKILEENKLLSQNIEKYQEKNWEMEELLGIKDQEILDINEKNDKYLTKIFEEGARKLVKSAKKHKKRLMREVLSNLAN